MRITEFVRFAALVALVQLGGPAVAQTPAAPPSAAANATDSITITGKSIDAWKNDREKKEQMFDILDDPGICPDGFEQARRGIACAIITYDVVINGRVMGRCNAPVFRLLRDGGPVMLGRGDNPINIRTEGDYVAIGFRRLPCPPDAKAREVALVMLESLLKPEKKSKGGTELKVRMILGYQQLRQQCATMETGRKASCEGGLALFDYSNRLDNCAFSLIWGPPNPQCKLRG